MKIDMILPQRKGLARGLYEKPIINENVNVIQREPKKYLFSSIIDKFSYAYFVRSKVGKGIKHITGENLGYLLYFIPKEKTIVTCHGINIPYLNYFPLHYKLFYRVCLNGMARAEKILAVSNRAKKDVLTYTNVHEDNIEVIYEGINHEIFYPNPGNHIKSKFNLNENDKIILYVGSEQPRKNLPTLVEAVFKLKEKIPNIKLIKVGHAGWPGARDELVKQIEHLGLQKDVIFAGIYPNEELPKFYNSGDVFVFPSYSEGFGVPPIEAMACGLPVITTNKTSLPEIVGDAAIKLSDPFDSQLLADTIQEVLLNDELRSDMKKKGIEQAKKYSWEKYAKDVWELYNKMIFEGL